MTETSDRPPSGTSCNTPCSVAWSRSGPETTVVPSLSLGRLSPSNQAAHRESRWPPDFVLSSVVMTAGRCVAHGAPSAIASLAGSPPRLRMFRGVIATQKKGFLCDSARHGGP